MLKGEKNAFQGQKSLPKHVDNFIICTFDGNYFTHQSVNASCFSGAASI